jgi:acetyl-CoA synthetase
MIALDLSGRDLSSLRLTVSAGEAVNPQVVERWQAMTSGILLEAYGLTETLMLVANYRGTKVKPGSMGRQLPGVELELFGEDGKPAGPGQVGQIALRLPNPQMMLGYRNDPDKSAAVLHRHGGATYFMTSDNARRDGDGYLYYEGRSDDVINSAGYRIGPQEVENALMEHPSVKEAAAVPSPDAERGEVVKAFIVLHAGYAGSDALVRELQDFVKRLTAPYKYPRRIEFVEELPKSPVGKIQRRELKARERARMENMA